MRRTGTATALAALVVLTVLGGCHDSQKTAGPRLSSTTCPGDVDDRVVLDHSCSWLDVPIDRSAASAGTARLFVVRVQPPGGNAKSGSPVVFVGTDLGETNDYVGNPPLAQRIGRDVYLIDPRGTGHSQPSLNCPELDVLSAAAAAGSLADASARDAYVAAVGACRNRLDAAKLPVAQFGIPQQATDLDDLRRALNADRLSLITTGTTSRIAAEYVRQFAGHVDRLVLDTPTLPGGAGQADQLAGVTAAFDAVAGLCTRAPACQAAYGDLHALLARGVADAATPMTVTTPGGTVLLDPTLVLRYVRAGLTDKDIPVGTIPEFLAAVTKHDATILARLLTAMPHKDAYCLGYKPACRADTADGVVLTIECADATSDRSSAPTGSLWTPLFDNSPWAAACAKWPVPKTAAASATPLTSDAPTLITRSQFDPWSARPVLNPTLAGLTHAQVLDVPNHGHNVLAFDCVRGARNAWFDNPSAPITRPSCLQSYAVSFTLPRGTAVTPTPSPDGTSAPAGPASVVGTYTATFTQSDAQATLTRGKFSTTAIQRVLQDRPYGAFRLELRDNGDYQLANTDTGETFDKGRFTYSTGRLVLTANGAPGDVTYQVTGDPNHLTLTLLSDKAPDVAPGVPDEAFQRVLYTTMTWAAS